MRFLPAYNGILETYNGILERYNAKLGGKIHFWRDIMQNWVVKGTVFGYLRGKRWPSHQYVACISYGNVLKFEIYKPNGERIPIPNIYLRLGAKFCNPTVFLPKNKPVINWPLLQALTTSLKESAELNKLQMRWEKVTRKIRL